ncbi:MAG: histidine kinase dimerization/phospho-acceptor domain-containing protein [Chloroflexota bacterium]|jgi:K+-sensing histidine kinase KdpD
MTISVSVNESRKPSCLPSMTAHDLRTPLSVIQGYAHLLEADLPSDADSALYEYVTAIKVHSALLEQMIDSLVAIDQARHGMLQITPTNCDLEPLLIRVIHDTCGLANEKGVVVRLESSPVSIRVSIDEHLFARALANIICYEVQRIRARDHLVVDVKVTAHTVRVAVGLEKSIGLINELHPDFVMLNAEPANDPLVQTGVDWGVIAAGYLVAAHGGRLEAWWSTRNNHVVAIYLPEVLA